MARDSIESFLMTELPGARSVKLTVGAAGPVTISLLTTTEAYVLEDALDTLESSANADATIGTGATGITFAFSRSLSAGTVTFAADMNFDLEFVENMHTACGFASATGHTGAMSYASDTTAKALAQVEAVGFDVPTVVEEGTLTEVRHGRSFSTFYQHTLKIKFTVILSKAQWLLLRDGPLFSGRVRIRGNNGSSDFSATNLGGYHDASWVRFGDVTRGRDEGFVRLTMEGTS